MSRIIEFSDEQYRTIQRVAATRGQTPAALLAELIENLGDHDRAPRYYEMEDWFRHLGATEEQVVEAKRVVQGRSRMDDAHS